MPLGGVVLAIVCVGAVLASCGGGSGDATGTPPTASTAGPTPASSAAPGKPGYATPMVANSTYAFGEKGYSIDVPAGWKMQPNEIFDQTNARFPTDAIFAPETVGGIQPSISVTCMKPQPDQTTTDAFRDGWKTFLGLMLSREVVPQSATVEGQAAWAFEYVQPLPEQTKPDEAHEIAKRDVTLVEGDCRWLITLVYPGDKREQYVPTLEQAMASVKFLP